MWKETVVALSNQIHGENKENEENDENLSHDN
jgi:hypothetical protein